MYQALTLARYFPFIIPFNPHSSVSFVMFWSGSFYINILFKCNTHADNGTNSKYGTRRISQTERTTLQDKKPNISHPLLCPPALIPQSEPRPNLPQHRMSSLSFNLYVSGPYTIGNFLHLAPLSQALWDASTSLCVAVAGNCIVCHVWLWCVTMLCVMPSCGG